MEQEKKMKYECEHPREPLIFEPEDWTEEEWATILKIFGMEEAERIMVSYFILETFGIKKERPHE